MNKLNWPTAFVITAIIFAGAFIYNKPTDAAFGSDEMIVKGHLHHVWHFKGGKIRYCYALHNITPDCSPFSK